MVVIVVGLVGRGRLGGSGRRAGGHAAGGRGL